MEGLGLFRWCVASMTVLITLATPAVSSESTYSLHASPTGNAPYIIVEKNDGEYSYSGFVHEFLDAFDRANPGYNRKHVLLTRKRARIVMSRGHTIDIVFTSPSFVSDETLTQYQFSTPLLKSNDVVVTRKDRHIDYQSAEDLYQKSVGIMRGYSYAEFDDLLFDGLIRGVEVNDHKQGLGMLHKKRVDAYFGNDFGTPWYIKKLGLEITDFTISSVPLYQFEYGFLVSTRKPELLTQLNVFITTAKADGTLEALTTKYLE